MTDYKSRVDFDATQAQAQLTELQKTFSKLLGRVEAFSTGLDSNEKELLTAARAAQSYATSIDKIAAAQAKASRTASLNATDAANLQVTQEKAANSLAKSTAKTRAGVTALNSAYREQKDVASGIDKITAAQSRLNRAQSEYRSARNQGNALTNSTNTSAIEANNARQLAAARELRSAQANLNTVQAQGAAAQNAALSKQAALQEKITSEQSSQAAQTARTDYSNRVAQVGNLAASQERYAAASERLARAQAAVSAARSSGSLESQLAAEKELSSASREVAVATERMNAAAQGTSRDFGQARYVIGDAARTYATIGTIALGAVAGIAAVGVSYETSFSQVARVTDATGKTLSNLRRDLKKLATEVPVSFDGLSQIAKSGAQMGIATKNLAAFTKVTAEFANTTGVSDEKAATYFGRLTQNLHLDQSAKTFNSLGSAILDIGTKTTATDAEVAEYTQQLSVTGRQAGLTAAQVVGLGGTLASLRATSDPSSGVTAIQNTFSKFNQVIGEGGTKLSKFAKISGLSTKDFADGWKKGGDSAQNVFNKFLKGLSTTKDMDSALRDLGITNVRQVRTLEALAQNYDFYTKNVKESNKAYDKGTEISRQYGVTADTLKSKLKILANVWANLGDSLSRLGGESVLKTLVGMATSVGKALNSFVSTPVGKAFTKWAIPAAALVGVFGLLKAASLATKSGIISLISANERMKTSNVGWWDLAKAMTGASAAAEKVAAASTAAGDAAQRSSSQAEAAAAKTSAASGVGTAEKVAATSVVSKAASTYVEPVASKTVNTAKVSSIAAEARSAETALQSLEQTYTVMPGNFNTVGKRMTQVMTTTSANLEKFYAGILPAMATGVNTGLDSVETGARKTVSAVKTATLETKAAISSGWGSALNNIAAGYGTNSATIVADSEKSTGRIGAVFNKTGNSIKSNWTSALNNLAAANGYSQSLIVADSEKSTGRIGTAFSKAGEKIKSAWTSATNNIAASSGVLSDASLSIQGFSGTNERLAESSEKAATSINHTYGEGVTLTKGLGDAEKQAKLSKSAFSDLGSGGVQMAILAVTTGIMGLAQATQAVSSNIQKMSGSLKGFSSEITSGVNSANAFIQNFSRADNWSNQLFGEVGVADGLKGKFKDINALSSAYEKVQKQISSVQKASSVIGTGGATGVDYSSYLSEYQKQIDYLGTGFKKFGDQAANLSNVKLVDLIKQSNITQSTFENLMSHSSKLRKHMGELADESGVASTKSNEYKIAAGELGVGLTALASRSSSLSKNLAASAQANADLGDTLSTVKSEMKGMNSVVDQSTNSFNYQTQAGRDAATGMMDFVSSQNEALSGMVKSGASAKQVGDAFNAARSSFINTAEQMGFTADQAKSLADTYFSLDSIRSLVTNVKLTGADDTIITIDGIKYRYAQLPNGKTTLINADDQATTKIGDVEYSIATLPNGKTVLINANNNNAVVAIDGVNYKVSRMPNGSVKLEAIDNASDKTKAAKKTAESFNGTSTRLLNMVKTGDGWKILGKAFSLGGKDATGGPIVGHLASGGGGYGGFRVQGPGTGTSDTAGLFALSNGEYVLNAATVRAMGGFGGVKAFTKSLGTYVPNKISGRYATGGPVATPTVSSAIAVNVPNFIELGPTSLRILSNRVTELMLDGQKVAKSTTRTNHRLNANGSN